MRSQLSDFIRELTNKPADDFRDPLLRPSECCKLFCEEMDCKKGYYYKHYYPYIKFDPIIPGQSDKLDKRNNRIPFSIALGLISMLSNRYNPEKDPAINKLMPYLKKVPPQLK
jgi:hypothetical protein